MTLAPALFHLTGAHTIPQGTDWVKPMRILTEPAFVTPFVISTHYLVGDYVRPSGTQNGFIYLAIVDGVAAGTEPAWVTVKGGRNTSGGTIFIAVPEGSRRLLDTTGYTAEMKVRPDAESATVLLSATTANSRLFTGFSPEVWDDSTVYAAGDLIIPTYVNGWVYQCINGGTTGGSQPVFPTTLGQTVSDGGVIWRCVDDDDEASNLRISLTAALTTSLSDFGDAVYDLEMTDVFDDTQRYIEGAIWMSKEVTR